MLILILLIRAISTSVSLTLYRSDNSESPTRFQCRRQRSTWCKRGSTHRVSCPWTFLTTPRGSQRSQTGPTNQADRQTVTLRETWAAIRIKTHRHNSMQVQEKRSRRLFNSTSSRSITCAPTSPTWKTESSPQTRKPPSTMVDWEMHMHQETCTGQTVTLFRTT